MSRSDPVARLNVARIVTRSNTIFCPYTGLEYTNVHSNVNTFQTGRGLGLSPLDGVVITMLQRLLHSDTTRSLVFIRLMVGAVFLSEGIQKFLLPDQRGVGRFTNIGLPMPEILGPFVGTFEIVCGSLILLGLATRLAAIPLLIIMTVALSMTKWPMLMEQGFWFMVHEARTDWSMFLGSLFLLIVGAGPWSVDSRVTSGRRSAVRRPPESR